MLRSFSCNMFKKAFFIFLISLILPSVLFIHYFNLKKPQENGAPPYVIEDLEPPDDPYAYLKDWKRPEGVPRVGLQIGHLENDQVPEELVRLIGNTGAAAAGFTETEVNEAIAKATSEILMEKGIAVDLLPTTVPPDYWADVFVAIHADGSTDTSKRGFKVANPRRDFSGGAEELKNMIEDSYKKSTGFEVDPNITRNMTGYYAFAWWRYEHAIHPMTTAVIVETGFLTNSKDRKIIVNNPEISARGIADGILNYLENKELI